MDSGEIRAGQASCPISELELELKSGSPQQLFKLALALLDIVPMDVEHTSKAEYGYLLFSAAKPSASKGRFPVLKKSQSCRQCIAKPDQRLPGACAVEYAGCIAETGRGISAPGTRRTASVAGSARHRASIQARYRIR